MSDEAELSTQNQAWNKQQKAIQSQKSMRLDQPLYLGSDNQLELARERADFLEAEVARLRAVIARKSRTSLVTIVTDLEVRVVRAAFISLAAATWATGWFLGDPASVLIGAAGMLCVYGAVDGTLELLRRRP